ncbi:ABC transporter permease [Chitinophagaceae bacterium LWZ2-11]
MIRNYIRIAWRNLLRHKFISFINLFGLTIGLTCCLLILTYIVNEVSYDKGNKDANDIYRVTRSFNSPDGVDFLHLSSVAPPFGPLLQNEFPDIKSMTRMLGTGTTAFKYGDKLFNEKDVFFADENFFNFFSTPVIKGNAANALTEPASIMLSEETAKKYFGDEDPMNKLIKADNQILVKVTGVFKSLPVASHIHPKVLVAFNTLRDSAIYGDKKLQTNWGNNAFLTYLKFPKGYPVANIQAQFPAFLDKYLHNPGDDPAASKASKWTKLFLQKMTDIHLYSHLDDEVEENGDIKRVYIFSAIALFILLIACINYMNLSTARSILRAKEIGIRKVIGAQRKEIITQFLGESLLLTYIAFLFAIVLTITVIPYINKLSGQQLSFTSLMSGKLLLPVLLLPLLVGLLSGIYPALFMSSFKPVKVLKGFMKIGNSSISFRKVLVVTQFSVSIILIVATIIVFQQLQYMRDQSLGFNKDHIITTEYIGSLGKQYEAFKTDLLDDNNIKVIGRSSRIPTGRLLDESDAAILAGNKMEPVKVTLKYVSADYDFIPTYGIQLAAGRNFSREFGTDSNNYVINETAVKMLGWKTADNALGKDIRYGGVTGKVIGVMKDFHFESMHQQIIPIILNMPLYNPFSKMSVKISGNNMPASIKHISDVWHKYLPEIPFEYTFLDERFDKLYHIEEQQASIFTIFSFIAILVACLGLFGLSAFTISQRVKEIGIRKVLGASVSEIVRVLSIDFLRLVLVAAIIALPVAWFMMNKWLQDFAYRVSIQWWVMVAAGVLAAVIAFITISFQAVKAALANPVKSLRTE